MKAKGIERKKEGLGEEKEKEELNKEIKTENKKDNEGMRGKQTDRLTHS